MTIISIVIPLFNRADIVHETLESIRAQSFQDFEIILIDDGSTDNTLEVVNQFASRDGRIHVYERPPSKPKGANACRNYGFTLAKGKYIKWVDSDDLLTPDALESQLNVFAGNPKLKVCFGQGIFFNALTRKLEERWSRKINSTDITWDYIRNNVRWPIGGPLWRKDFFAEPPFHEALRNSQEWLMHGLQLLKLNSEDYFIMDINLYLIRRGNVRMSSSRNATYYFNQSKARLILLKASFDSDSTVRFRAELLKQMLIYYYHSVASRLSPSGKS